MAILLNLETATTNCSVSIAKNGKLLFLKELNSGSYSHAEQLNIFIQEALDGVSLSFSDLDAVAVSKGPGSYTGLRIGVSTAKGLCFSLDIPLIAIATLESMAHQIKRETYNFVIPALDARRMEIYALVFDANLNEVRETKAEIINKESFQEYIGQGKVHIIGSGAEKCKGVLKHPNISFDSSIVPSAKDMCLLSFKKFKTATMEDIAYFEPYYLKDFMILKKKN